MHEAARPNPRTTVLPAAASPPRPHATLEEALVLRHWTRYPSDWQALPEEVLLGRETLDVVLREIEELPEAQQAVIRMRNVEGWSAGEVCATLELSEGNERVLLHRARSRVRAAPALLGFVAARINEAIAGAEGYHAERARQSEWLVERLGLDG
jgi:DNA-directed RNA polymerase specialized sigma24 family protein